MAEEQAESKVEQEAPAQPAKPTKEAAYEAQLVIEQFVANSAFRDVVQNTEFRNAIQYLVGTVAGCSDFTAPAQSVRVSIVSDNGAVDFRYTLKKAGPQILQASPDMLSRLQTPRG